MLDMEYETTLCTIKKEVILNGILSCQIARNYDISHITPDNYYTSHWCSFQSLAIMIQIWPYCSAVVASFLDGISDFTVKKLNTKSSSRMVYGYMSTKDRSIWHQKRQHSRLKKLDGIWQDHSWFCANYSLKRSTWLQVLVVQPPGSRVQEPSPVPQDPSIPLPGNCSPYSVRGSHPPVHPSEEIRLVKNTKLHKRRWPSTLQKARWVYLVHIALWKVGRVWEELVWRKTSSWLAKIGWTEPCCGGQVDGQAGGDRQAWRQIDRQARCDGHAWGQVDG